MGTEFVTVYPKFVQPRSMNILATPVNTDLTQDSFNKQSVNPVDPKIQNDLNRVKDTFEKIKTHVNEIDSKTNKDKELNHAVFAALSPIVPIRRIASLQDNMDDGNYTRAAGLLGLALINLPEDIRDLKGAWNQIIHGKLPGYDFKACQTPFSFFRGTVLEPLVNKLGKFGVFLHKWDIPLSDTSFGEFLEKVFKFKIDKRNAEETNRFIPKVKIDPETGKTIIGKVEVLAYKIEGKPIGKLIGRALLRLPLMSVIVLGLLELPAIIRKIHKANGMENKAEAGAKQGLKSIINVSSILAGIGLVGALFARKGPAFSLLGMGIGSVAGAYTSKVIQKEIDYLSNKK